MISAALEVDVTKDWFDYLVAVATAAGTVGAVLVAVLWPGIHARRRRPVLSLRAETYAKGNTYRLGEDLAEDAMTLILANEPSKDSAENVEVFVTAISAIPAGDNGPELGGFVTFVNLNFASSLDGHDGIPQSTVPPGFQRRVYFLATGLGPAIASRHAGPKLGASQLARFEGLYAAFETYPARKGEIHWLHESTAEYKLRLDVTGSNFSALRFEAVLAVEIRTTPGSPDDPQGKALVAVHWEQFPSAVRA